MKSSFQVITVETIVKKSKKKGFVLEVENILQTKILFYDLIIINCDLNTQKWSNY